MAMIGMRKMTGGLGAKRMVGGIAMTEFAMSQAFYEHAGEKRLARLSAVGHDIDDLRNSHLAHAKEGMPSGWESCVAIINGRAHECHRVGRYTIIVHGETVRMNRRQRVALWLAAPFRQIAKAFR